MGFSPSSFEIYLSGVFMATSGGAQRLILALSSGHLRGSFDEVLGIELEPVTSKASA